MKQIYSFTEDRSIEVKEKKAFTLVEVLVVVGIIALLAGIAFPNYLRTRIMANEAAAKAGLKSISNALETYAVANGSYPLNTTALLGPVLPYLNVDLFTGDHNGYLYSAALAAYSYSVVASPANPNTGLTTYTITTGAVLSP